MTTVAKRHQDKLSSIQENIRDAHEYFQDNYNRYNRFRKFVFESSLTDSEIQLLASMGRPQLEFNVLEAYISRLLGEFSKQEPDILVHSFDETADPDLVIFLSQHLKAVFSDDDNTHLRYEVYKDLLSGGFSAMKVYTDYEHAMSMNQTIKMKRCEPTLCGFDKLAQLSHKGDGNFCFELFPMSVKDFEKEHPDLDISKYNFSSRFENFNWTYISGREKVVLVADYYEKRKKEEWIVNVKGMGVMLKKKYDELVLSWDKIELPPPILGKPRKTLLDRIDRYRLIQDKVIEHEETDYDMLPIIFVDGHSLMLKSHNDTNIKQMTRPYVYHAEGAQRLKNYAGISLANEIENTVQHKFMVAKEALPKEQDLLTAYKNVQKESVLVFNSVYEKDPDKPIMNPVREIQRVPAPPEITQAFMGSDSLVQNILGSYDASLGINDNQLSGVAIVEAASQSNATAMPYIVGCLQGFQRAAEIYVSLVPKYFVTPRSLPIIDEDGQRQWIKINQEGGIELNYSHHDLSISLKAGASFQVQKSRTINMMKEVMGMSNEFSAFVNSKGLSFILDNMEGKGIEELKKSVSEWQQEQEQMKAKMMEMEQQAQMQNPAVIRAQAEAQKIQLESQKNDRDFDIQSEKLLLEKKKMLLNSELTEQSFRVDLIKAMMNKGSKDADIKIKSIDTLHRHRHDINKLNHDISKSLDDSIKMRGS